jgi:ParE toxin of type II toxin-antitoxin system, parDE
LKPAIETQEEEMKDYEFLEPAQTELEEKVKYYNDQQAGLGYDFAREVADTIARILRYPKAWTKLSKRTRRCRTKRFPYGVVYQIRGDKILVGCCRSSQKKTVVLAR